MKRSHSKVQKVLMTLKLFKNIHYDIHNMCTFQSQPTNSKQMKITTLFSRIPTESSKTITEYNEMGLSTTPNSKSFSSPLSSPDVIPPSPVLEKKRGVTKSKRCINPVFVDENEHKDKLTVLNTHSVPHFSNENIGLLKKNKEIPKYDNNDVDSQSCSLDTVSIESSLTEFSSDFLLDWLVYSS